MTVFTSSSLTWSCTDTSTSRRADDVPRSPPTPDANAQRYTRLRDLCSFESVYYFPRSRTCCLNQGAPERRSLQLRCTLGAIRPEVRYAKWAGGSRSQTHRRAAKGGFTQDDGYVQGVAPDAHDPLLLRILLAFTLSQLISFSHYNSVLDTDTGTGPIPSITVSGVNAYSGGVLARALPEGLRYLST
jgi:hypothetical protein